MSSDATQILAAVVSELAALYPDLDADGAIYVKKREAAHGKQLWGGWTQGMKLPCLIVTEGVPEPIDKYGSFDEVSVGYPILIEYAKATAAKVPSGDTPTEGAEDSDIRDNRQTTRRTIYRPALPGLTFIIDVEMTSKPPYEIGGGNVGTVSGQVYRFETWEPRADAPS